jgi:hypothetical protein
MLTNIFLIPFKALVATLLAVPVGIGGFFILGPIISQLRKGSGLSQFVGAHSFVRIDTAGALSVLACIVLDSAIALGLIFQSMTAIAVSLICFWIITIATIVKYSKT